MPEGAGPATEACIAALKTWIDEHLDVAALDGNAMALGVYINRLTEFADELVDCAEADGSLVDADILDEVIETIDAATARRDALTTPPATPDPEPIP